MPVSCFLLFRLYYISFSVRGKLIILKVFVNDTLNFSGSLEQGCLNRRATVREVRTARCAGEAKKQSLPVSLHKGKTPIGDDIMLQASENCIRVDRYRIRLPLRQC